MDPSTVVVVGGETTISPGVVASVRSQLPPLLPQWLALAGFFLGLAAGSALGAFGLSACGTSGPAQPGGAASAPATGGGAAGTYNAEATEIFHEGIRLPVLKLFEKGKRRDDLWKLLLLNSRSPDLMEGDLGAMLGSTRIGADYDDVPFQF